MTWTEVADGARSWLEAVGGLAGAGALTKYSIDRRNQKIDAAKVLAETSVEMLAPLRAQLADLDTVLARCQAHGAALGAYLERCLAEIRRLGGNAPPDAPNQVVLLPSPKLRKRSRKHPPEEGS